MDSDLIEETKLCTVCNVSKPVEEFQRDRTRLDGRKSACKPCRSLQRKAATLRGLPPDKKPSEEEMKSTARRRALKRLVENHQREYTSLVQQEYSRIGIQKRWVQLN